MGQPGCILGLVQGVKVGSRSERGSSAGPTGAEVPGRRVSGGENTNQEHRGGSPRLNPHLRGRPKISPPPTRHAEPFPPSPTCQQPPSRRPRHAATTVSSIVKITRQQPPQPAATTTTASAKGHSCPWRIIHRADTQHSRAFTIFFHHPAPRSRIFHSRLSSPLTPSPFLGFTSS